MHIGGGMRKCALCIPKEIKALAEACETLKRVPCQFWACEGWEQPFEEMKTCYVCQEIQSINKIIEEARNG